MPSLPLRSLNALVDKAAKKMNLTPLDTLKSYIANDLDTDVATDVVTDLNNEIDNDNIDNDSTGNKRSALNPASTSNSTDDYETVVNNAADRQADLQNMLDETPLSPAQRHTLYYVIKGLSYLPTPLLENIISSLKGSGLKQYENANAHLRLILAVNGKLKRPFQLSQMSELRKRFAADAVAMQSPKVWQQPSTSTLSKLKALHKRDTAVYWYDKTIADADKNDMTIRCYQSNATVQKNPAAEDETVMLFFHGGGFCIGDIDTHHEFCHVVCAQTGWSVVSVDYRLAPEYPAPTALRDCIAAYAWLANNSHTLGASASRIVLAGDSAGGCLATLVAQQVATPNEAAWLELGPLGQKMLNQLKDLPHPVAQMPLYPVTDVDINYPSWSLYGEGLLLDHDDIVVFEAGYMQRSSLPRRHALISPMWGDSEQICPTYMVAAELDILHDQAYAYAEKLKNHCVDVQTYTVLGAPHGFIHLMSVHQGLGKQTRHIIDNFATFVNNIINDTPLTAA